MDRFLKGEIPASGRRRGAPPLPGRPLFWYNPLPTAIRAPLSPRPPATRPMIVTRVAMCGRYRFWHNTRPSAAFATPHPTCPPADDCHKSDILGGYWSSESMMGGVNNNI